MTAASELVALVKRAGCTETLLDALKVSMSQRDDPRLGILFLCACATYTDLQDEGYRRVYGEHIQSIMERGAN